MRRDPSSSDGLGGSWPQVSTDGMSGPRYWIASCTLAWSSRTVVVPTRCGRSNTLCRVGLRRSASISATRWPAWARATARLAATVDLPSEADGEVTTQQMLVRSTPRKAKFVRSFRNASATGGSRLVGNRERLLVRLERRDRADHRGLGRGLQLLGALERAVEELPQKGQAQTRASGREAGRGRRSAWSGAGSARVGRRAGSTRLTRRAEPLWSSGTVVDEGAGDAVGEPLGPGRVRVLDAAARSGACRELARHGSLPAAAGDVNGWGSRRRADSAVVRDSRIWANDFTSC